MLTTSRTTALLALLSGGLLVVDTVAITVLNRSFGLLDDALFLGGFGLLLLTGVAVAVDVSRPWRGARRVGCGVAAYLAFALVLGAVSWIADTAGRHIFSTANVGLHGEWSFFSIGVCLLLLGGWANRRSAGGGSATRTTTASAPAS